MAKHRIDRERQGGGERRIEIRKDKVVRINRLDNWHTCKGGSLASGCVILSCNADATTEHGVICPKQSIRVLLQVI